VGREQEPPQWFKHPFVLCFALGVPILAAILLLRWWLGYEQTTLVSVISGVAAAHLALHLVSGMRRVSPGAGADPAGDISSSVAPLRISYNDSSPKPAPIEGSPSKKSLGSALLARRFARRAFSFGAPSDGGRREFVTPTSQRYIGRPSCFKIESWYRNNFSRTDMTELSSTYTEEDRIGDWFAAQLESGAMDLEGLPRRMARLGLMTPEQFLVEMGERMGSDLAEQKPWPFPATASLRWTSTCAVLFV
jgi:hypothetical protein